MLITVIFETVKKLHKVFYNRLFYKLKLFTLLLEEVNDGKANQVVFSNSLT